jgi:type I restriction enzyme R subunit
MSYIKPFTKELAFEEALTEHLLHHGWNEVIKNPTEEDLVKNWARILYDNNRSIDRLGNHPLTDSEMQQVIDKVNLAAPHPTTPTASSTDSR